MTFPPSATREARERGDAHRFAYAYTVLGKGAWMIVCIPVTDDKVDPRWGRASRIALAQVADGQIVDWQEHAVEWRALHDAGTEGSHHARVARFLRDHRVDVVVANHMGTAMARMLGSMGLEVHLGAAGDTRAAVGAIAERRDR